MLVFEEGGKLGYLEEKTIGARIRTNNKLNPHMALSLGIEPGAHWWEASTLTTAPSLLLGELGIITYCQYNAGHFCLS